MHISGARLQLFDCYSSPSLGLLPLLTQPGRMTSSLQFLMHLVVRFGHAIFGRAPLSPGARRAAVTPTGFKPMVLDRAIGMALPKGIGLKY